MRIVLFGNLKTMNYILLAFLFLTSVVILGGSLLITLENKLPTFFRKNFRYGKFGLNKTSKLAIEVPKSWFKHYYVLGLCIFPYCFYMVICTYIFNTKVPKWFIELLNITCGQNRAVTTSATKTYIAFTLLTLQVFRRFYDTHYISIFGKNGRMGLSHYIVGLFHYPGCALAILCEAPKFVESIATPSAEAFNIANISKADIAVVIIFLWAWWHQHKTTIILANLRKDEKGTVVTDDHKVPYGDWFYYLTAPHQTAEIIMYMALTVLLWRNITWFFAFTWVLSNQIDTILLTHWWYQEKFRDFPKHRKALIPCIY